MNYESKIDDTKPVEAGYGSTGDYGALSEQDKRRRRWTVIGAIVLIALVLVGAWMMFNRDKTPAAKSGTAAAGSAQAGKAGGKDAPTVTVAIPARQTVDRVLNASGTLAARREVPIGVVGEGGRVIDVRTDAGGWVSQGQVLVVVERSVQNEQVRGIEAQIGAAQSDARLAQAELDRAQALIARGFISKADVDRKRAARDAANAQVRVAQAQLSELRARNARLDIRAPASGYILSRAVEIGQVISSGSPPLFTMARGGEIELNAQLNEADLATISTGVRATVVPVGTTQSFSGQVWQIAPTVDANTRQGIARIALPFDRALRPGGFANAQIVAGAIQAPILPDSAIMTDDTGDFVWVVDAQNKVHRRAVKTGLVTPQGIAVAEGLNGTELVVLRAGGFITEGDIIKPSRVTLGRNGAATPTSAGAATKPAPAPSKTAEAKN